MDSKLDALDKKIDDKFKYLENILRSDFHYTKLAD